jgi:hypothetical protein
MHAIKLELPHLNKMPRVSRDAPSARGTRSDKPLCIKTSRKIFGSPAPYVEVQEDTWVVPADLQTGVFHKVFHTRSWKMMTLWCFLPLPCLLTPKGMDSNVECGTGKIAPHPPPPGQITCPVADTYIYAIAILFPLLRLGSVRRLKDFR